MPDVVLRPFAPGEMSRAREAEDGFDDFGPRQGNLVPPPSRVDDNGSLAVVADGVVIGGVGWRWAQWGPSAGSRCPMIGIYLEPSARGRGVGTRAQQLVVELLFRHTATNRIEAHTDVENIAEQRALERAGLTREGVVRGAQWRDGAYRDGYLYSVLRAEWQALSAG